VGAGQLPASDYLVATMPIPRPNPILSAGLMVLSLLPAAASARVHKLERLVVIGAC
jgi:hypothetical protein